MTIEESKLQLFLAHQLPDVLDYNAQMASRGLPDFKWKHSNKSDMFDDWFSVTDQEWLHICHLIEASLAADERDDYYYTHLHKKDEDHSWTVSAPWQLRAEMLARVKGIEI